MLDVLVCIASLKFWLLFKPGSCGNHFKGFAFISCEYLMIEFIYASCCLAEEPNFFLASIFLLSIQWGGKSVLKLPENQQICKPETVEHCKWCAQIFNWYWRVYHHVYNALLLIQLFALEIFPKEIFSLTLIKIPPITPLPKRNHCCKHNRFMVPTVTVYM